MANMSYCRWQNIRKELNDAISDFNEDKPLNDDEKTAMKDCCEMFAYLLQVNGLSEDGYNEVDFALTGLYTYIDTRDDE